MPQHDARAVADLFHAMADHHLTRRQAHHLVFLAQGWGEAVLRFALVCGHFTASDTGPVHADLLGWNGADAGQRPRARLSWSEQELVERVWRRYGHLSSVELGRLLLQPGTPWANVAFGAKPTRVIARSDIGAWCTRLALAGRATATA